jgi:hypothetical protein
LLGAELYYIWVYPWLQDVGMICEQLPDLVALNLSYNLMAQDIVGLPHLESIRILVLNNIGIDWTQVPFFFSLLLFLLSFIFSLLFSFYVSNC